MNVLGDSIGAGIVYELSKKELEKMGNVNANGDVERPSNEIAMDTVESSKMWDFVHANAQVDITCSSSAIPLTSRLQDNPCGPPKESAQS